MVQSSGGGDDAVPIMASYQMRDLGSCSVIAEVMGLGDDYHCCTSCHEDEDLGYNIFERYNGDGWVSYCCGLAGAIEPENIPWDKLRARMD